MTGYTLPLRLVALYAEAGYTEADSPRPDMRKFQRGNRTHVLRMSPTIKDRILAVTIDGHPMDCARALMPGRLEEGLLAEIHPGALHGGDPTGERAAFFDRLPIGAVVIDGRADVPLARVSQKTGDDEWDMARGGSGLTSMDLAVLLPEFIVIHHPKGMG